MRTAYIRFETVDAARTGKQALEAYRSPGKKEKLNVTFGPSSRGTFVYELNGIPFCVSLRVC